jgi:hypothetical protein
VEKAINAFCGTWFNSSSYGTQKDIYYKNGKYEWHWSKTGTKASYTGDFKIEKAWQDHEGNIWFTVWRSYEGNSWTLNKVSDSGTVLEYNRYYSADKAPSKVDPDSTTSTYFKYFRTKNE